VTEVQICTTTLCLISSFSVLKVLRYAPFEFIQSEAPFSVTCELAHALLRRLLIKPGYTRR